MLKRINYRILALFIFVVLCWGLAWPVNKIGLQYMSPLWYTASRLLIGTFAMLGIVIATRKFVWPSKQDIPLILVIGVLQISIYILLTNVGLAYLPAGRSSLLAYTTPLWVMPIGILFFNERPGPLKWIGFILGVVGLVLLINPWELNWSDTGIIIGTSALLLASLIWVISMFLVRYLPWHKSPLQLIPWQLLVGAIPILLYAGIKEPIFAVTWNTSLIVSLIYTGVMVTGVSYWIAVIINKELPTIVLSLGFLIVPIFSFLVSAIFLGEKIPMITGVAIALVLLGLACVVAEREKPA